jgi:hypothetical protein
MSPASGYGPFSQMIYSSDCMAARPKDAPRPRIPWHTIIATSKPEGHFPPVRETVEQLRTGDHAALFYRSRAEQFSVALPYIQIGLACNERCLYIAGDNSIRIVSEAMKIPHECAGSPRH